MRKLIKKLPSELRVRALNKNKISEDLETLRIIFNDAWSENWGFTPFTKKEFAKLGNEMLKIIPINFIQIAEINEGASCVYCFNTKYQPYHPLYER